MKRSRKPNRLNLRRRGASDKFPQASNRQRGRNFKRRNENFIRSAKTQFRHQAIRPDLALSFRPQNQNDDTVKREGRELWGPFA